MNPKEPSADVRSHFNEIVTDARVTLERVESHRADTGTLQERFSEALIPLGMPDPPPAVRRDRIWPRRLKWIVTSVWSTARGR